METTSKRNDENKIELTVTLTSDEVKKYIDAAYKTAGKARIPGFRPGKAPRRVLENFFGGKSYFLAQATDDIVKETIPLAIDQEGNVPLDKPDVPELGIVEEGKDFAYTVVFTVRPVLELSSYDPVEIELPSVEPSTEEVEAQIETMLQYYIDIQDVFDRPVKEHDSVRLKLDLSAYDDESRPFSGEDVPYELNSAVMPPDFDNHLMGMTIGETREFDYKLPVDEGEETAEGKVAHAVATLLGIKEKIKPDLTDEWVKAELEYESIQDFRDRISESLRSKKQEEIASLKVRLTAEELASRLLGEPSDAFVSHNEQDMYREFFQTLQNNNQTFDSFLAKANTTAEGFREGIKMQAKSNAAEAIALAALARHLGLEVTDEEIREEFYTSGVEDPENLYKQWKENGRLSEIRDGLLMVKASKHLNDNAVVFEPGKKPASKKAAEVAEAAAAAAAADLAEAAELAEAVKLALAAKSAEAAEPAEATAAAEAAEPEKADKPAKAKTTAKPKKTE